MLAGSTHLVTAVNVLCSVCSSLLYTAMAASSLQQHQLAGCCSPATLKAATLQLRQQHELHFYVDLQIPQQGRYSNAADMPALLHAIQQAPAAGCVSPAKGACIQWLLQAALHLLRILRHTRGLHTAAHMLSVNQQQQHAAAHNRLQQSAATVRPASLLLVSSAMSWAATHCCQQQCAKVVAQKN